MKSREFWRRGIGGSKYKQLFRGFCYRVGKLCGNFREILSLPEFNFKMGANGSMFKCP